MEAVNFRLPEILLQEIDYLVATGKYASRSDVIRVAIEEYLERYTQFLADKQKTQEITIK